MGWFSSKSYREKADESDNTKIELIKFSLLASEKFNRELCIEVNKQRQKTDFMHYQLKTFNIEKTGISDTFKKIEKRLEKLEGNVPARKMKRIKKSKSKSTRKGEQHGVV